MKELNAADLRRELGSVARSLERDGAPVLLKLRGRPVGVIVSLKDFQERFALRVAAEERRRLVEEILEARAPVPVSVDDVVREVRGS